MKTFPSNSSDPPLSSIFPAIVVVLVAVVGMVEVVLVEVVVVVVLMVIVLSEVDPQQITPAPSCEPQLCLVIY